MKSTENQMNVNENVNSTEAVTETPRIRTEVKRSAITVDEIKVSEYQKEGTKTAQLRQIISTTSYYPSKQVANNLQDNLFDASKDFGFEEKDYTNDEQRVAWIDVPEKTTIKEVMNRLKNNPKACIYRILSNTPILTDAQQHSITVGQRTMDEFANTQVVRYPDGTMKPDAEGEMHDVSGQIVLDNNGKVQYRRTFFSLTAKEDVDKRTNNVTDSYMSDEISEELQGASSVNAEQTV